MSKSIRTVEARVRTTTVVSFSAGRSIFAFQREPVFAQSGDRLGSLVGKSRSTHWLSDILTKYDVIKVRRLLTLA
jgi:hypothetical protein